MEAIEKPTKRNSFIIPEQSLLDGMDIMQLVKWIDEDRLVVVEGHGGENTLGFLPKYIMGRIYKETTLLEGSEHSYDTFDTYTLRVPNDNKLSDLAVMVVHRTGSRGYSTTMRLRHYNRIMVVTHVLA